MQNINKKVLVLCYYSLCWSVLASQFRSDFSPIPASYAEIFPPSSNVDYLRFWPWRACARWTNGRGGGSRRWLKIVCGCARKIIIFPPSSFFSSSPVYNLPEAASVCHPRVGSALCNREREGNTRSGRKQNRFVRVRVKLFWRAIYCANPRPEPDSQSRYLSRRGMGRKAP